MAAADRAPVPVIGHWHAAFDADAHALRGFRGLRRKQAPEKRHSTSPVRCPSGFLRNGVQPSYTLLEIIIPQAWTASAETRFGPNPPSRSRNQRCRSPRANAGAPRIVGFVQWYAVHERRHDPGADRTRGRERAPSRSGSEAETHASLGSFSIDGSARPTDPPSSLVGPAPLRPRPLRQPA